MGDEKGEKFGEEAENVEMEMRQGGVWIEGSMQEGVEKRGNMGGKREAI